MLHDFGCIKRLQLVFIELGGHTHIDTGERQTSITAAIGVAEVGMARMREALEPGMTENALWAKLHEKNIALGGEWIETRLLASGPRTNPWFHESSLREIQQGVSIHSRRHWVGGWSRRAHSGSGLYRQGDGGILVPCEIPDQRPGACSHRRAGAPDRRSRSPKSWPSP